MTVKDYAEIGSNLECGFTTKQPAAFARRYGTSTDSNLRTLAAFALFKCSATSHRLAGRIDEAMVYESYCETEYNKLPTEARW